LFAIDIGCVCCSGDGVDNTKQDVDVLNVTRMCCGNDSEFMDMTTCVGGLVANDTAVDQDSPVLSPALEQENNVNHGGRDAGLVDAHNKSVFYEDEAEECDLSLTCCVGSGGIVSSASAQSLSAANSAPVTGGCSLSKSASSGENDDMQMTQCLPLDISTAVGNDMEMTQCLPLNVSVYNTKSSCRWPFGKRQDKERISRYEENSTSICEADDLDVLAKVDTAAFLSEMNTSDKPDRLREVYSAPREMHEVPFTSSSTCFLPSALSVSGTICATVPVVVADEKAVETYAMPVSGRDSEYLPNVITDPEDVETRDKHRQLLSSSSSCVAAVEHQPVKSDNGIVGSSDVSTNETLASFVTSKFEEQGHTSADFLTKTAPEAEDDHIVVCVASSSLSSTTSVIYPPLNEVTLSNAAILSLVPPAVNQEGGYQCQLEKSAYEEAEHLSQFAEKIPNVANMSTSFDRPVRFGADAVESLFAAKESCEVSANDSAVIEHVVMTTAITGSTQTTEPENTCETQDMERGAFTCVAAGDPSRLSTSVGYDHIVASETTTEAQKLSRSAVQNMVQSADDLLTRVKLANSMPPQVTSKFRKDNVSASAYHSFRLANLAVKQNLTSVYGAADKSHTSSLQQHSSTASAFQLYNSTLDRTRELTRSVGVTGFVSTQLGVCGNSSRIDISAQHIEPTDTLPSGLISFGLTENLNASKQEVHLEPIRNVKSLSSESYSAGLRGNSSQMDISAQHIEPTDTLPSGLISFSLTENLHGSKQEVHLEPIRNVKSLSSESYSAGLRGNSSRMDISAQHIEATDTLPSGLISFSLTENLNGSKQAEVHLEPIRNVKSLSSESYSAGLCGGDGEDNLETETSAVVNMEVPLSVKSSSQSGSSFTLPMTITASALSASHLPTAVSESYSTGSHGGDGNDNLITSAATNVELPLSVKSLSQCGISFTLPVTTAASASSASHLPTTVCESYSTGSHGGDRKDNLETSAAVNVELPLSVKSSSQSGSSFTLPAVTTASASSTFCLPTTVSESHSTGSCAGDRKDNLETSSAMNVERPFSVKASSQSGSSFMLPMTTTASAPSTSCLPTVIPESDSTGSRCGDGEDNLETRATLNLKPAGLTDEDIQLEVTADVNNLSLASHMSKEVDMETSDSCHFAEVPPVAVAGKSASASDEKNSSLPTRDVSQSSVLYVADSETSPTRYIRVPSEDAGPISVSNNKVRMQSQIGLFANCCSHVDCMLKLTSLVSIWLNGEILVLINVVTLRQARSVPGWVFGRVSHLSAEPGTHINSTLSFLLWLGTVSTHLAKAGGVNRHIA